MSEKPIALKLGGSVITIKDLPMTPNIPAITRLAEEISRASLENLILVHGGGSYGHPLAHKYRLDEGFISEMQLEGFSKVHLAMLSLNSIFVDKLLRHGIPAVSVQPSSCIVTRSGRIELFEDNPLKGMLKSGLVPVLYGDVVYDSERCFSILSGDQLISNLAIRFGLERIILGTDVDGLFTKDPKLNPDAQLIKRITLEELEALREDIGKPSVTDVTRGMYGKVSEVLKAVEEGVEVKMVNASVADRVYKALKDEEALGTSLVRD